MKKKLLILVEGYPHESSIYNMSFVHSRNLQYQSKGFAVDVLSFSARNKYQYEGINVLSKREKIDLSKYDVVLSHAPNIRNHYRFIVKNYRNIKRLILFFHGHEALIVDKYYPKPYIWQNQPKKVITFLRYIYDRVKLRLLKRLLKKEKVRAIYVSDWMRNEGRKCLELSNDDDQKNITLNNAINQFFHEAHYEPSGERLADFITIRPLDGSKYAVDKVVELAQNNPLYQFHIYGKGEFFKHIEQPDNVTVFNTFIEQKDIPALLNQYRGAVMPTRLDAQGVMMCEMASYGIPTLVSDLPVCREMLSEFPNCTFVDNDAFESTIISEKMLKPLEDFNVVEKFSPECLAEKELNFIFESN